MTSRNWAGMALAGGIAAAASIAALGAGVGEWPAAWRFGAGLIIGTGAGVLASVIQAMRKW